MRSTVIAAMGDDVHYGNILTVPAYCVGDIAHHISQSTFNMCKDDMTMGIIEATTDVIETSLRDNLDNLKAYLMYCHLLLVHQHVQLSIFLNWMVSMQL